MGADPRAQTRTSESDGIGNDARAPRPHGAGFIFYFFGLSLFGVGEWVGGVVVLVG